MFFLVSAFIFNNTHLNDGNDGYLKVPARGWYEFSQNHICVIDVKLVLGMRLAKPKIVELRWAIENKSMYLYSLLIIVFEMVPWNRHGRQAEQLLIC